jgi:endonuclease/exonuclease/phosphatase family metal-dependent hydrolase
MTYNIHLEGCLHDHPSWDDRRSLVAQVIRLKTPEILGLQGTSLGQMNWLLGNVGHYSAAYDDGSNCSTSDLCPILYDHRIYEAIEKGTVTLDIADSEDLKKPFVNWVKLEHLLSERTVYVINTSLDGQETFDADADISTEIKDIIADIVGDQTFMMLGDFGSSTESGDLEGLTSWAKDSQESSLVSISDIEETYLGWEKGNKGIRKDFVFLSKDIPANSHEVLNVAFQNKFPSDHLPVFCRIRLN